MDHFSLGLVRFLLSRPYETGYKVRQTGQGMVARERVLLISQVSVRRYKGWLTGT